MISLIWSEAPKDYLWKKRIILVRSKKHIASQQNKFKDDQKGFQERKLKILFHPQLKDKFGEDDQFLLIGLDGGVKARSNNPFERKEIYGLIDSMPMRQSELKKKN
ncbi:MAG: DUF4174 domain-containing protein [Halobacteriovoraceae bacterium]|nr:DUF4174 domain-containing protein [Halobacteriovoraceae bacterium]